MAVAAAAVVTVVVVVLSLFVRHGSWMTVEIMCTYCNGSSDGDCVHG